MAEELRRLLRHEEDIREKEGEQHDEGHSLPPHLTRLGGKRVKLSNSTSSLFVQSHMAHWTIERRFAARLAVKPTRINNLSSKVCEAKEF